jgi:hypothetical protein
MRAEEERDVVSGNREAVLVAAATNAHRVMCRACCGRNAARTGRYDRYVVRPSACIAREGT